MRTPASSPECFATRHASSCVEGSSAEVYDRHFGGGQWWSESYRGHGGRDASNIRLLCSDPMAFDLAQRLRSRWGVLFLTATWVR